MKRALQFRKIASLTLPRVICALATSILVSGLVSGAHAQQPAGSPAGAAPQPSQAESPAAATNLRITYDGSTLSIVADNAALSDILSAVPASTKADIDIPASASGERIPEVRLGPGPSRDVLGTLLDWTNFDYIIQGSDANPYGIQRVVLFARDKAPAVSESAKTAAPVSPPAVAPQQPVETNARFGRRPGGRQAPPQQSSDPSSTAPADQQQGAQPQAAQQPFAHRRQIQQQGQTQSQDQ